MSTKFLTHCYLFTFPFSSLSAKLFFHNFLPNDESGVSLKSKVIVFVDEVIRRTQLLFVTGIERGTQILNRESQSHSPINRT